MNQRPGILITKPVGILNKQVNLDLQNFFTGIIKVGANAAIANWGNIPENIVDIGAAFGLAKEPGEIAWLLIFQSLIKAMASLIEDNSDLLREATRNQQINLNDLKIISEHRLNESLTKLDQEELTIYKDFFENPQELSIVTAIKTPFAQYLESLNLTKAQAEVISQRLPVQFIYALHEEWANNGDKYARLQAEIDTLFIKAVEREAKRELSWRRYFAWLQNEINQRVFDAAFTLKDVYVPLRAFYKEEKEEEKEKKLQKIVVDLDIELQSWLDEADRKDAIRVICGGPGSGKSSFTKMFAAKQAEYFTANDINKPKVHVLYIPLHLFNIERDLVHEIGRFIKSMRDIPLPSNPLESDNFVERLLIIFDGLDELAMQGKMAEDVAQKFVSEVRGEVNRANSSQTRLQVLISGRELVVQNNSSEFRKPKQILYVLPYFIEEKSDNYVDNNKLLNEDQRQLWWQGYGAAIGHKYSGLPAELDKGRLKEITSQPLLNYLVALSYEQGELKFTEDSNLNEIFADLLTRVYKRVWADDENPHIRGVEEQDFVGILEGIAIAAWHGGDGRKTTVKKIESLCDEKILKRVLEVFKTENRKAGITRLLTAFYFRKSGYQQDEETFEFTHKSFGEYLAARRIVWEVKRLHEMQELSKSNSYINWTEKDALKKWAELCGLTAMDEYLFDFVVNEIRLQHDKYQVDVSKWQETLCDLISFMLRNGMPMELLPDIQTFHQANQQARNAEEALLAVLNACARVTKKISHIKWPSHEAFGNWISRLHGQRVDFSKEIFCLNCLSFLDLQDCVLVAKDLYQANLEGVNFQQADLEGADLRETNMNRASFLGAYLQGASLADANLQEAILEGTDLSDAYLGHANLKRAILVEANLERVDFKRAILVEANLEGADLDEAELLNANLQGANLQEAYLAGANLQGANLQGANLQGAYLAGANLQGAKVEWPKLLPEQFQVEDLPILHVNSDSDSND